MISVLQLMSLVEVLKGDRAERSLSEKTLKWELSSLNLASFSARLDSEDGLGDNRLSICSFLVIGAEMLVRFELMASDSGSGSSPSSNSDVSTSTFSLLHRVTLWRMNLIMSCRGKFVWHTPHTRRSFSCSKFSKVFLCCGRPCFRRDMLLVGSLKRWSSRVFYIWTKTINKDGGQFAQIHGKA